MARPRLVVTRANQFFKLGCHGHGGPPTWPCEFRAFHAHADVDMAPHLDLLIGPARSHRPDKLMFPAVGFTKGQVVKYYRAVARIILRHLRNRPLTLKLYPNGVVELG